jgi:hypothetical protein
VAERDTRAMVSAGWWQGTPQQQRQHLVAGRMLALPDGTWWIFGAWGRWYRLTPADGQWHLCPPPQLPMTRRSARPLQQGMPVPPVPPHVVPTGPDLSYTPPTALTFVDAGIRTEITSRVRATVESAAALPVHDYPHWWALFSSSVPSTVALTWGVMLWCATAPVFDARLDGQLLGLWSSYRARPLPEIDGPRWLTPPPLESLVGLYTERLRSGRVDAAVVVLRTMWAMAGALREDSRFQPRADALIAMLGATLQNPTVDYGALAYGDQAVVQQWLTRCPPALAPALRVEASAGEHFRNSYYDLTLAVTPVAGDPGARGYVEPRLIAAALLAADLAVVRQDVSSQVIGWLDPQVSDAMRAMLIQRDHPLRPFWPEGDRLPRSLRDGMEAAGPAARSALLATMYGADLAWCRLGGGIPARPRGFPSSVAVLAEIIGSARATSATASEPVSQTPGIAPLAQQYPSNPGTSPQPPVVPMVQQPPTGPPGQPPSWTPPGRSGGAAAVLGAEGLPRGDTPGTSRPGTPSSSGAPGGAAGRSAAGPPATEAWAGAQPWPAASESGVPPAAEAWQGTADAPPSPSPRSGPGTDPPPATQAWPGTDPGQSAGAAPAAGTSGVPPATQAWPGVDEAGTAAPAPAEQGWPDTDRGQSAGGGPAAGTPGVPPATQAWPDAGAGETEADPRQGVSVGPEVGRPGVPTATRAWPGTGETAPPPVEHDRDRGAAPAAGAPGVPPATRAWPGADTGAGEAGTATPAAEARPGADPGESAGAAPAAGTSGVPPATRAWPGTGAAASPAGWAEAGADAGRDVGEQTPAAQGWPGTDAGQGVGPGEPVSPPATRAWPGAEDGTGEAASPAAAWSSSDADAGQVSSSSAAQGPPGTDAGPGEDGEDASRERAASSAAQVWPDSAEAVGSASGSPRQAGDGDAAGAPDRERAGDVVAVASGAEGIDAEDGDDTDADPVDDTSEDDPGDDTAEDAPGEDDTVDDEVLGNVTMMDSLEEHVNHATTMDPLEGARSLTYVDWVGGTRADAGSIPIVPPSPVPPGPPRTRMIEQQEPDPPERPGTRVLSEADLFGVAPMPERPVEQIAPPPAPAAMPTVAERFGIRFLSGADDAGELFDGLSRRGRRPVHLLIVGDPHTGQRRLTRLVARTLAGTGLGDGSVRTADGSELRGDHVTAVTRILRAAGPPLLFERLDRAVLDAPDPARVVAAVTSSRESRALIATCDTAEYDRLPGELKQIFQVFRLPDLTNVQARLALLHVLADERRVTITASGLDVVRGDLSRLGGHGDIVGARLVEAYLDRAVARHVERAGAPRDRMVLVPVDFAGVAEELEPALRPPRDVDGYLRGLEEMIGLDDVKRTVGGLVAEARMAADRATRGLPSGNPSRHLIFLGRPGTGKATVAGLIGGIYAALNLLDTGQLVICGTREFAGGDGVAKVTALVERAMGGVLLIEDAHLLGRMPAAVEELSRLMEERRDKFMVICASLPDEMEGFLLANPGFRAEFGAIIEFREPTERQLVQLFSRLAERELYMLDEELRVELIDRFAGMRRYPRFAFADTVRRLFDQIVARQAARLAGARVDPAAVARLSVRDLPESQAGQLLQELHPDRLRP